MELPRTTPLIIADITDDLTKHFGNNLASVLLYGSGKDQKEYWDIDLLVILKEKKDPMQDLSYMRTIYKKFEKQTLDLQLFYSKETQTPDTFSLDAHGAFFSPILAQATALFGGNPFIQHQPSEKLITVSLITRIQRYIFQARQEYFGVGRYNKDKNPQYHHKHVLRTIFDVILLSSPCSNASEALVLFKKRFSKDFTKAQWKTLETESGSIAEYMECYERVYDIALRETYTLLPEKTYPVQRSAVGAIAFEYCIPTTFSKVIILIDGLPRKPELTNCMQLLASWGYAVFFPRLAGTWESGGTFLDHNPADDITRLTQHIKDGILLQDGTVVSSNRILTLGTSFGGLLSLYASLDKNISHSIAFSPVYAMSKVPNSTSLDPYIQKTFQGAYRYTKNDWKKLISDKNISLPKLIKSKSFDPKKCTVIAGKKDVQITYKELQTLCKNASISLQPENEGHLSLHTLTPISRIHLFELLKKIEKNSQLFTHLTSHGCISPRIL
jgi:hypothetical protein